MNKLNIQRKLLPIRMVFLAATLAVIFTGCDRSRMDKGYEYFPDMAHSAAYETYSDHSTLPDLKSMMEPVEGTIPIGFEPYPFVFAPESREKAGKLLMNPFTVSPDLVAEGKDLFVIFCQGCHGVGGEGDGILHSSGKYPIKPASLVTDLMKSKPGGEMYHVITAGWGVMGAHASLIRPEDRWKIVMFVEQTLQHKQ